MNNRILFLLFIAFFFAACEDKNNPIDEESDDDEGITEEPIATATQEWIESIMRTHYYWYNEIPASENLDYTLDDESFFYSMLSKKDGKEYDGVMYHYSYIENLFGTRTLPQTNNSYGFEFMLIANDNTYTSYRALVFYTTPGSPAETAGVKRGDWITRRNGESINANNYNLLYGAEACTFTVERWDDDKNDYVALPDPISVSAAHAIEDNPVFLTKVIPWKGKKVGYLVYNHFTDGKSEGDVSYDNELRSMSAEFKEEGVNEFVLDLRYNNGGLLSSATILCAILAPETALGKELGHLKYNDKQSPQIRSFNMSESLLNPSGRNLNLETLYVLTSNSTASASEMIINSLKPFMEVVVIGEQTEGKNVGSLPYTSEDKNWEMHPIVCQIYNSDNFTDYANGFPPDYELNEAFEYVSSTTVTLVQLFPLGDENERMLNAALRLIDDSYTVRSTRSASAKYEGPVFRSIDRKATNGVVINVTE
jgi:Periplasmic protease